MANAGIDISSQKSEALDLVLLDEIDLLITVCGNADEHCPTVPTHCEKLHWPFDDPAKAVGSEEEIMAYFFKVRDQIKHKIQTFLQRE